MEGKRFFAVLKRSRCCK